MINHSKNGSLKPHLVVWLLLFLTSLHFSCKTKKTDLVKTSEITHVKTELNQHENLTSTEVSKTTQQNTKQSHQTKETQHKNTEQVITFLPEKDQNGNQLIATITTREISETNKSNIEITETQFKTFVDSLKSTYQNILNFKIDSLTKINQKLLKKELDSTLKANIPWWMWLLAVSLIFISMVIPYFLRNKPKQKN